MAQTNYTPISLYYSTTASAVPTAANLVQGELAINTADGKLYYEDSSGVVQVLATKSTGSIGGSNTQVQFNNSGSLGGSSSFTWDGTTVTATKFAGALNGTVGATTASTGAFTTLTSNGATTFTAGTASTSTTTGTTVITGGLGVSGRVNAANFDGIVGANTAAAGSFTTINASTSITNAGLTSGRVTFAGTAGLLQDDADFTFNGTTVTMANDASISGLTVGKGGGALVGNTAVGLSALPASNTGTGFNTAVGYLSMSNNTSGQENTAVGVYSLPSNTTGSYNVAIGRTAVSSNTTGSNNVGVGYQSLNSNTTASNNTAVGYQAGYTNTVGQECAYIGGKAGYSTTGGDNTFVGYNSGNAVTTGYANTIIGKYSGSAAPISATGNNFIVLSDGSGNVRGTFDGSGNFLVGTTTSSIATVQGIVLAPSSGGFLANNSTTSGGISLILLYSSFSTANETKFEVTSEGNVKSRTNSYAGFSDIRLKQGITPASSQWNDIKNIEVVKFQMKSEQFSDAENPWMLGVIAQQVEQVSPGLVNEDAKDGMKTVKYSILYMKAVKALQEAMERIETLEAKVSALESK